MGIRNSITSMLVLATGVASTHAYAETPAQQLTRLSDQTAILKAQKAHSDAALSVMQTDNQIKQVQPTGTATEYPVLKRIERINGPLVATIAFGDVIREGKQGEGLNNGWKIYSITPVLVTLVRGKEHLDLAVSSQSAGSGQIGRTDQRGQPGAIPLPAN